MSCSALPALVLWQSLPFSTQLVHLSGCLVRWSQDRGIHLPFKINCVHLWQAVYRAASDRVLLLLLLFLLLLLLSFEGLGGPWSSMLC